jgi:branched-chain amino acid transport system permease protein
MFVLLQNLISLLFGDDTKMLRLGPIRDIFIILGVRITIAQLVAIVSSVLLCMVIWPLLRFTRTGIIYRSLSTNTELARVCGVHVDRVILLTFVVGSALAGFAGIVVGYDLDLTPRMGFNALLMGLVAAVIGGIGSIPGAMLGGIFIGLAEHLSASWLPTQWQDAIAFIILLVILIFRPQGFIGKKVRKATV